MDCRICRSSKAEFEIADGDNTNQVKVCSDCLVASVRWSQDKEEWDDGKGTLPFTDKSQVAFAAPIYDFIQTL